MRTKARLVFVAFAAISSSALASCRDEPRASITMGEDPYPPARPIGRAAPSATVTRPPPPPPSADELSLLAPLEKGADLGGGFVLRDIRGVEDGVMRLVCANGAAVVRLDVALASDAGPTPPASAGRYAIFYSLKGAAPEDGERLAKRVAAVLAEHASAPPPPGMTPFVPREKPGSTL